jgi:redox-sensitive bicupin YhaK (pirin superfamily)
MSAGSGIAHAEYNMEDEVTQLFQIWILPDESGGQPSWGAKPFPKDGRAGQFVALASGMANDNDALPIRTNARVAGATMKAGETLRYALGEGRSAYLVPATGKIEVNGVEAKARDGLAIRDEAEIAVTAIEDSEVVLVDAA